MKSSEVVQILKGSIASTKESGAQHVSIENLEAYALRLEETVQKTPADVAAGEAAMEAYKADLNSWASSRQQSHEFNIEMLKATIITGQSALKSSLLINGGAAAAMLAFVSKIWPANSSSLSLLSESLAFYVFGVLSAAIASGFTYVSQAGYAEEFGKASNIIGIIGHAGAVIGVVGSYLLFGRASWLAYLAVVNG